jgi:hypothetical protein
MIATVDPLLASGKSANPQTFNRYIYVMNNPLLLTDPSGLQAATWAGTVWQAGNIISREPVVGQNNEIVTGIHLRFADGQTAIHIRIASWAQPI